MARIQKFVAADKVEMVPVKVGDVVGFKADVEQHGVVTKIEGDWLTLEDKNGFSGEYIGGMKVTREHAGDCWAA